MMFEYDEDAENAVNFLDQYDFTKILKDNYNVEIYDIIDIIESTYNIDMSEIMDGLTEYEFAVYLHKRYNMHMKEISHYYVSWNSHSGKIEKED